MFLAASERKHYQQFQWHCCSKISNSTKERKTVVKVRVIQLSTGFSALVP